MAPFDSKGGMRSFKEGLTAAEIACNEFDPSKTTETTPEENLDSIRELEGKPKVADADKNKGFLRRWFGMRAKDGISDKEGDTLIEEIQIKRAKTDNPIKHKKTEERKPDGSTEAEENTKPLTSEVQTALDKCNSTQVEYRKLESEGNFLKFTPPFLEKIRKTNFKKHNFPENIFVKDFHIFENIEEWLVNNTDYKGAISKISRDTNTLSKKLLNPKDPEEEAEINRRLDEFYTLFIDKIEEMLSYEKQILEAGQKFEEDQIVEKAKARSMAAIEEYQTLTSEGAEVIELPQRPKKLDDVANF